MQILVSLSISVGASPATDGGGLPWLWIGIAIGILILAAIVVYLFRAGAELEEEIYLVVTKGERKGEKIKITSAFTTIGSERDNDVVVGDDKVSQHHARLKYGKGKFKVIDANSLYGTFLNGERVADAECNHGDTLRFGPDFECRVEMETG